MILSYLRHKPCSQDAQIACYIVDEALEILETSEISTRHATQTNDDLSATAESGKGPPAVWRLLKTMRMELDTLIVQKSSTSDYPQLINSTKVSGSNNRSNIAASPATSFCQQPQHASTASSFSLNGHQTPQPSPNLSTNEMPLGFDLGSIPSYLGGAAGGQTPLEAVTGLDISDLDLWSSIILQGSEDLPTVGDFLAQ